jgi:uncharacterized membrane protein YkvA (DUF1232 family)
MVNYLKSKSFQRALKNAAKSAKNPQKMSNLIESVNDKLSDMDKNKKNVSGFFEKLKTMLRMLRAYISGEYREIPWRSLLLIIGSLVYFLMPLDLIPDFIPMTGLADDISLIFLVFGSIGDDIDAFIEYEQTGNLKD